MIRAVAVRMRGSLFGLTPEVPGAVPVFVEVLARGLRRLALRAPGESGGTEKPGAVDGETHSARDPLGPFDRERSYPFVVRGQRHAVREGPGTPERADQPAGRARRGHRRHAFDPIRYKRRNVVERCFNRLKHFTGIATRYDKLAAHYRSAVTIACLLLRLR